jgi:hypothetical protein
VKGLICDNCGTVLALDGRNGESSTGEEAAWISIEAGGLSVLACTRACAIELLGDDGQLREVIDAYAVMISEIAHAVNGRDEDADDDDDEGAAS